MIRHSGLTHFLQCFNWATLGLHSAHFWAKSFFPMFLLGWNWARFGLSRFFSCFCWAGVGPVVGCVAFSNVFAGVELG